MEMITIQEVGTEILNGNPRNFYIFGGNEYGIKMKYVSILKKHYNDNFECYDSVMDLIHFMRTKHFIPLVPTLYVVRYDDQFVSSLDDDTANVLKNTNIIGTIICIYDNDKQLQKLDKQFPDNTVSIGKVSDKYIEKYLKDDFPDIPDNCIKIVTSICTDYSNAVNICNELNGIPKIDLLALKESDIKSSVFIPDDGTYSNKVKKCIASRNYSVIVQALESYHTTLDNFLYDILSTLIELEKLNCVKSDSELLPYIKRWKIPDIYNMFQWTYRILNEIRTTSVSPKERIMFLVSLMQFSEIPGVDELNGL